MKILLVHNYYQQAGGEDEVFRRELSLLESHDCIVDIFSANNEVIKSPWRKFQVSLDLAHSHDSKQKLNKLILAFKPDVVHAHNFFPVLTPSIYDACIEAGVPVVQTLHNYRTICPGALLMRDGLICESCVTASPYQAMLHRCYRNSVAGSWAVARMVAYHRKKKTWQTKVARFIALTEFSKQKFVEAGFPEEKISVKPNFYDEGKNRLKDKSKKGNNALFVGRLSTEKGVGTMLSAWNGLDVSLRVAGDGPLLVAAQGNSKLLGRLISDQVSAEMAQAAFLVMPSECYENFPLTLAESFAHGLPVVASRLGAMAEIVEDGITGLHFEPGNPQDLARKVQWMHDHPDECRRMGENARRVYEAKYTPERNYEMLMDIYQQAIASKKMGADMGCDFK